MSWEIYLGVALFTAVWALVSSASQFKSDENDDNVSASIKSLFKTLFIGAALILSAVGIGNTENVIEASITPTNSSLVSQVVTSSAALYRGTLNTYMAFIFFLFVFVIYMIFRNLKKQNG